MTSVLYYSNRANFQTLRNPVSQKLKTDTKALFLGHRVNGTHWEA